MAWIKRHLFFVVGGVLTLVFLGGAGFFIFQNYSRNSDASGKLDEIYSTLKQLAGTQPQPGNDKIDNIALAKDQEKQLLDWVAGAAQYFVPIPPIPAGTNISSAAYTEALRQTIDTLQHEASSASIALPPQYSFSFSVQRSLLKFSGSLDPLAVQLGEVKAISEILFAARVNDLDGIQRVRASDDDASGAASGGSQSDYIDERPITNDLAIITPYVVTFRSFTPELGRVVTGFATSSNLFIVRSVSVQPAGGMGGSDMTMTPPNNYPQPGVSPTMDPRYNPDPRYRNMPNMPPPAQPQPGMPEPSNKGGLQTILKEQLLRVTLEVEIVKLRPKS